MAEHLNQAGDSFVAYLRDVRQSSDHTIRAYERELRIFFGLVTR